MVRFISALATLGLFCIKRSWFAGKLSNMGGVGIMKSKKGKALVSHREHREDVDSGWGFGGIVCFDCNHSVDTPISMLVFGCLKKTRAPHIGRACAFD